LFGQLLVSTPTVVGVAGVFTIHSSQSNSLAIDLVSLCELSPAQVLVSTPASQVGAVVTDHSPQECSCEGWLLEDSEPPPELEEEGLPLPELLEAGASSPPPSPPQALSVNAMASARPAAIAGAKNFLPLQLSFVSIFFSFLGFNGLDY
jgi:hypothetical protein